MINGVDLGSQIVEAFKTRGLSQSWCQRNRGAAAGDVNESGRLGRWLCSPLHQSALLVARALEVGGTHTITLLHADVHTANAPSLAV